jgi:Dyp-type peroxidase family
MPVQIDQPLSWKTASGDNAVMLDALQANILKGHVRDHLTLLFLKFSDQAGARNFLKKLVVTISGKPLVKSARQHLLEVEAFKATQTAGTAYVGVGLTQSGYAALGVTNGVPSSPAFLSGMKNAQLGDPAVSKWDTHFQQQIDAVILIGDASKANHDAAFTKVWTLIGSSPGVSEIGHETGLSQINANGEGIEHFGYVDGRSQPLFLTEDIESERLENDGATTWDPAFPLSRVIVPDQASPLPAKHFGSYFVFRKLEQNVQQFKTEEKKLAKRLNLNGSDAERAGALIIGRFEDGTPVSMQRSDGVHSPVPNDFDYDSDGDGGKSSFFSHIRKMNPRGSGGFEPEAAERLHIMARRGQTYGVRADNPNDGKLSNKPKKDLGLMFMAFNADLNQQFEFVQNNWSNFGGFPKVNAGQTQPGLDLVIGQGSRTSIQCPVRWGARKGNAGDWKTTTTVPQTVTMKGGEYFFMPSIPFLAAL